MTRTRTRAQGDATPLIEGAREPVIATVSFEDDVYDVRSMRAVQVVCPLPFPVFECVRARAELQSSLRRPSARQRWVARVLGDHFGQGGVYYSEDARICSADFAGTDAGLCWARSDRYFCVFGYLGAGLAERRTPGHQSKRYFARGVDREGQAGNQLAV